jgi:hypothetical protein
MFGFSVCRVHIDTDTYTTLRRGGIGTMVRTRDLSRMGETAQTMVRTSQESAGAMWGYAVRVQELNTTLAQRTVETWMDAFRRQTELGRDATREIFEKAEEQGDALRSFYGQWTGMFRGFPYSGTLYGPRAFQRQGMRLVETATETAQTATEVAVGGVEAATDANGSFPIENYDELTVDEVAGQLGSLSAEELEAVRAYEKRNKDRETLLYEIERTMSFPIEGYDEMNVGEISGQLDDLSEEELKSVRDYEKRNKGRDTLLEQLERKIKAAS